MMWYFTKIYSMFPWVNKESLFRGNTHPIKVEATDQKQQAHLSYQRFLWSEEWMELTDTHGLFVGLRSCEAYNSPI